MSISVQERYTISHSSPSPRNEERFLDFPQGNPSPLQLWECAGFCDAEGRLAFLTDQKPQPLHRDAQDQFAALLSKKVTLLDHSISFKEYLEKVRKAFPCHQLYLRGSYASYLIKPLQELKQLIDAFLKLHPEKTGVMLAGYDQLLTNSLPLSEPVDADWALISDVPTLPDDLGPIKGKLIKVNAELADVDFSTAKSETFTNLNPARKNLLTLTEDPIVIASLKGSLDLLVGSPKVSPCLFSYDNRYIPFEIENPPMALNGDYWQSTLDHALGIIRLEPRHEMDFKALLIALKHASQGRTLIPSNVDYAGAFNAFVKNCPVELLFGAIESKMPKEPPFSICYLMNVLNLIEETEMEKIDDLWQRFFPSISAALKLPQDVQCTYSQMAFELRGFGHMPFIKETAVQEHPTLSLFIKKIMLLKPETFPTAPERGAYAAWAQAVAILKNKQPHTPIPISVYETLYALMELNALNHEELLLLTDKPITSARLLDRLMPGGNLIDLLPQWLQKNHQGDWEITLQRLMQIVKSKQQRVVIKDHLEKLLGSDPHREELYLAAFSQQLFKPDEKAKKLLNDHFNDYVRDRLSQLLQRLAPFIREKKWLTDLWIDSYLSGKIQADALRQRILIWFSSTLSNEEKEALALELSTRFPLDFFNEACVMQMMPHLKNPIEKERWLQTLLSTWTIERFLNLIEALSEMDISPGLLKNHLWNYLESKNIPGFIFLLTHSAFCKRVQIPTADLAQQLNQVSLSDEETDLLITADHLPLKEASLSLRMNVKQKEVFTKHLFSMVPQLLPPALMQFLYERALEGIYLQELKAHSQWLIEAFKNDHEKLRRLFRSFRLPVVTVPCPVPQSFLLALSTETPEQMDLELSLSLMKEIDGSCLFMTVLRKALESPSLVTFRIWLNIAFTQLKASQRTELLSLIQGRKEELLAVLEFILDLPTKSLQSFVEALLQALFNFPGVAETFDLKRIGKLPLSSIKSFQRFFETPAMLTRFITEYLLPAPVKNKALLEHTIVQADSFDLLPLFLAEAPWLRKQLPKKGTAFTRLRELGISEYLNHTSGSHEWLYEIPDHCPDPHINQLALIRIMNLEIDFSTNTNARTFLHRRLGNIVELRRQLGKDWTNHESIASCLEKICMRKLLEGHKSHYEGLFEWFNAIGRDLTQKVTCRSNVLQMSFLNGSSTIAEEAITLLFALLPEIQEVPLLVLRGLIFALNQYPHLPIRHLQDKIDQTMTRGSPFEQQIAHVYSRYLDLILCNRLKGAYEERYQCCISLFQAAVEAKFELLNVCISDEIIKSIGMNFYIPYGHALAIKDKWIAAVTRVRKMEPPTQTRLHCISELNERIFPHATDETFSGLLIMIAQDITSLIKDLNGGYDQTLPILRRLLEICVSNPNFKNNALQAETLIPLLPHLGKSKLIYYFILLFLRKDLEMPTGDYLKHINPESEIQLIHQALDTYLVRGDAVAARSALRIYTFSLKKKMPLANRLQIFEKTIKIYAKARMPIEAFSVIATETFQSLPNALTEKQKASFEAIIKKTTKEIEKFH